ncbi:type II toxin-antitoxin system HigB family toxin [Alcaligenaceae bacterium]|nr:type II toxin-antitoxin system HigB family toxin [Alcaligenaceae bacterium]
MPQDRVRADTLRNSKPVVRNGNPEIARPIAEQPIKAWVDEANQANWTQPSDIKERYRSASILKNRRVVFNIKGNDYRLIVASAYRLGIVYVRLIGTHAEYDEIDACCGKRPLSTA